MSASSLNPSPPVAPIASGSSPDANASAGATVYLASGPYPDVPAGNDPETVALLKQDYAGAAGELTGIMQYLYQNIATTNDDSFSNAMMQISIVEMTHLDMLGDTIRALGGNPSFGDGKYFWQASNVNYATSMQEMLQADIAAETVAIANYEKHAAQAKNGKVRDLLLRIIEDEKLHLRFFNERLAQVQEE